MGSMNDKKTIMVEASIAVPIEKVWELYTEPKHIVQWNYASPDWCSPNAENDLRAGGKFRFRMEAKDKSAGFDFEGIYDAVKKNELISYTMADGRKASVVFGTKGAQTKVTITFEAENLNPVDLQRTGWQAILDNFKAYAEKQN
jgi:uncharacterized protein YndB with AHSA1/START domain